MKNRLLGRSREESLHPLALALACDWELCEMWDAWDSVLPVCDRPPPTVPTPVSPAPDADMPLLRPLWLLL